MRFSQIPGHELLKSRLCESVRRSHVAHAQLLHGAEGGMQLALALAFASYLNCEQKLENDSCGRCASCRKMDKLAHPDFHFVFPTVKTKKVKPSEDDAKGPNNVDSFMPYWREFVDKQFFGDLALWHEYLGAEKNQQAIIPADEARKILQKISLKAYEAEFKIMLIWLPELMNITSANAILKILEEPPAKTLFLLVSNEMDKLLATIKSRVLATHIPAIAAAELEQYLLDRQLCDTTQAAQVSLLAEGNLLKAHQIIHHSQQDVFDNFSGWMRLCFKNDIIGLVKLADQFDAMDKTTQKQLMEYSLAMFRNILLYVQGGQQLIRLESKELDFVKKFSGTFKSDKIENINELLSQMHYYLERNAKAKILFLDASLQIVRYFNR